MNLVIAPHVDDDVLGASSVLGPDCVTFYVGVDDFHVVSAEERRREAMLVALETWQKDVYFPLLSPVTNGVLTTKFLQGDNCQYGYNAVNDYYAQALIPQFERLLYHEGYTFEAVYLPFPSYNQDHRAVYDAAMVALRPHDQNPLIPRVLLYEEPEQFWPYDPAHPFVPNYFVPLDVDRKLRLNALMKSQVRGHRSPEMIRSLAEVRGAAIMQPYAEAFHVIRWVQGDEGWAGCSICHMPHHTENH